jgi:hypothetical protein
MWWGGYQRPDTDILSSFFSIEKQQMSFKLPGDFVEKSGERDLSSLLGL